MTDNEFSTYPLSVTIAAESLMYSVKILHFFLRELPGIVEQILFALRCTSTTSAYAYLGRGRGISYMHGRTTAHEAPEKGDENTM
ncbi:uncharacterized protein Bfra_005125 [Botrytis fragariae]|uniref:Uncharacterized protein n=1 Tax=Botrytis fragariae TaxID=1964551 RepID=A0A8H6EIP0_9HELO|nr:uncharacterized protein Bfra_005125 [Botrytis fragariae]KAF5873661.1 hypothetical protein Bfra_005125 [Botrytis fragariae]